MAKRKRRQAREDSVQSYKELARARREGKARRRLLVAVAAVSAVVVGILLAGIINELAVKPSQPVAKVGEAEITTAEFRERVHLERALIIDQFFELADLYGLDVAYQFSGIGQLYEASPSGLSDRYIEFGEAVLDSMVDEALIRRGAAEMGVSVAEEKVSQLVEEREGYYRRGTPTRPPTSTPWPTPTPITSTNAAPTQAPTLTPRPSPTVVTQAGFDQLYQERLRELRRAGAGEEVYRATLEIRLLEERVRERLMEDVPLEADQVEFDLLSFASADDADGYLPRLDAGESFDNLMEEARSDPEDGFNAASVPWTTLGDLSQRVGNVISVVAFSQEVGAYSRVVESPEGDRVILRVTAHEVRELSDGARRSMENDLYSDWLEGLREATVMEKYDYSRDRVPRDPRLDRTRLIPTLTPEE